MLAIVERASTAAEAKVYAERRVTERASAITVVVVLGVVVGVIVGVLVALGVFGVAWAREWWAADAGTRGGGGGGGGVWASWAVPLVVGGVAAMVTCGVMWIIMSSDRRHRRPDGRAMDVVATAYAAWLVEEDGLDPVLVLRVEADRYVLITRGALTPPLIGEEATGARAGTIPCQVRLVLMGGSACRVAVSVSLSGVGIPLRRVRAMATTSDPEWNDEPVIGDGLYMTRELPRRIGGAVGVM